MKGGLRFDDEVVHERWSAVWWRNSIGTNLKCQHIFVSIPLGRFWKEANSARSHSIESICSCLYSPWNSASNDGCQGYAGMAGTVFSESARLILWRHHRAWAWLLTVTSHFSSWVSYQSEIKDDATRASISRRLRWLRSIQPPTPTPLL